MMNLNFFLQDKNDNISNMNVIDIKNYVIPTNYEEFLITDAYKFRLDKIATRFYGNSSLYYFIVWFNKINSIFDLDSGKTIKIPTPDFINRYYIEQRKYKNV